MAIRVSQLQAPKVSDPYWMLESEQDVYRLIEDDAIGHAGEYGFESEEELVDFMLGRGEYSDRNGFRPSQQDKDEQMDILRRMGWSCPSCIEEVENMLEQGALRGDIDRSTDAQVVDGTSEEESYKRGEDVREEYYFVACCEEHEESAVFSYDISTDELEGFWRGEV